MAGKQGGAEEVNRRGGVGNSEGGIVNHPVRPGSGPTFVVIRTFSEKSIGSKGQGRMQPLDKLDGEISQNFSSASLPCIFSMWMFRPLGCAPGS